MSRLDPYSEHSRRMNKVLDYIDRHLERPLDLTAIAQQAHLSPFHFHRVFAAWIGETPGDYLRRRRMEAGAAMLVSQPRARVLDVALATGFGSAEAFTHTFRRHFGQSPTQWRRDAPGRHAGELARARARSRIALHDSKPGQAIGNIDQARGNPDQVADAGVTDDGGRHPHLKDNPMQVTIVERTPVRFACLRHIGPYGTDVGSFWMNTIYPWMVGNGLMGRPRIGISLDDPTVTPHGKCRYDAGVEVPDDFVASGPTLVGTLPGGRYAVAGFVSTIEEFGDGWTRLLRDWLPASGLQLDARPCFEYYPVDAEPYDPTTGRLGYQICIPVRAPG